MSKVSETGLPGVGVRYDVDTIGGRLVGVVVHQSGRRDLVIYDERDRDRAGESVELTEDEGHTLAELLGGSQVSERVEQALHRLEDLVISWIDIDPSSPVAGLTLAEAALRKRTGAGVVALVSDAGSIPVPGGSERLRPEFMAVVVGPPGAVEEATKLLSGSG